ncbi:MAG: PAS domain S-box protein [Bacteroidota bacterium]
MASFQNISIRNKLTAIIRNRAIKELSQLNEQLEQRVKECKANLTKTQAALQLSQEKYHKIVEQTDIALYSSDYKEYLTYVNAVFKKLSGYTENELVGKLFLEIIAPDWKEKVTKFYKEQFDNKVQESLFSFPIITKSGEKKWIEQTVTQLKEGDLIAGLNAIVRDITERIKTEEKLKEYQYFFNNSHDLITIANESHFEIINPNFRKVLGYSEKELLEKRFMDFIHPDDVNTTLLEIEKLRTGVESLNFRNRYRRKDGSYLLFEWNVTPDPITGKFYASARDITDRKKAENKLIESEHFLNSIIENIPNMIFVKDAKDLRFVRFNKAGEDLLGYSKADLMGKNDYDFFPKTEADFFTTKDKEVLESGKLLEIEEEPIHTRYKGDRIVETKKIPILDGHGHPLYLLGISNDITDLKKLLAELKQKSEELANTNKELEQFVYVASHDLQEPLRTISNFVVLLKKKYSGTADTATAQYLQFVVDAATRMQNLIKDLLDLSRVGKNVVFIEVDCNEVLTEVIADMEASIKESNAKITAAKLPVLKGNTRELKQLFQNLISNAIKFHKKNVIPEINITVEDKNTEYLFAIKDNGIGIEEQSINKLFVIFHRLNTSTEYPGTGIGLATCKKIVDLHNGKIWIESKFGEGSTFYFTLPKENNLKHNGTQTTLK